MNGISINKYISSTGFCSRREAEKYLEEERVTINDQIATLLHRVFEGDRVAIDGEIVKVIENKTELELGPNFRLLNRLYLNIGVGYGFYDRIMNNDYSGKLYLEKTGYTVASNEFLKAIRKKCDELIKEVKQLENNVGFITNATESNPLVQNVMKHIQSNNEELKLWQRKLKYLNKLNY
jgi:hypothetical protein